jgi:hypothetical protein
VNTVVHFGENLVAFAAKSKEINTISTVITAASGHEINAKSRV